MPTKSPTMSDITRVFDLHNDLPTAKSGNIASIYSTFDEHKCVSAFFTTQLKSEPLSFITDFIKNYPPTKNRIFGIEDLHFVTNEKILKKVCRLPIVYASLTWNYENLLAGGANSDARLTDWGKFVVKTLALHNILIDTAHLNKKSFYDVCDLGDVRIINSHTCQNSIYKHARNISDKQIKAIIARRGVIGLTPVSFFLKDDSKSPANSDDYIKQIDTFCQKFGADNIGIGTDFYGAAPLLCLTEYADFAKIAHKLENLGYKKQDITKILFTNAENVICYK